MMAAAETAVAQSRSSRTYEDAHHAGGRCADHGPCYQGAQLANAFPVALQMLRGLCTLSVACAFYLGVHEASHTLAFRISFTTASTLPGRTSGDSFPRNFRILDFVVWSFALVLRILTLIL